MSQEDLFQRCIYVRKGVNELNKALCSTKDPHNLTQAEVRAALRAISRLKHQIESIEKEIMAQIKSDIKD